MTASSIPMGAPCYGEARQQRSAHDQDVPVQRSLPPLVECDDVVLLASVAWSGHRRASVYVDGKHMGDLPLLEPLSAQPEARRIRIERGRDADVGEVELFGAGILDGEDIGDVLRASGFELHDEKILHRRHGECGPSHRHGGGLLDDRFEEVTVDEHQIETHAGLPRWWGPEPGEAPADELRRLVGIVEESVPLDEREQLVHAVRCDGDHHVDVGGQPGPRAGDDRNPAYDRCSARPLGDDGSNSLQRGFDGTRLSHLPLETAPSSAARARPTRPSPARDPPASATA
jgi:hypothetical protein